MIRKYAREKTTNERLLPFRSHKQLTWMLPSTDRLSLRDFEMMHSYSCYRCDGDSTSSSCWVKTRADKWTLAAPLELNFPANNVESFTPTDTPRNEFISLFNKSWKNCTHRVHTFAHTLIFDSFCFHTSISVLTRVLWQSIDSWTGSHIVEQTKATSLPIEAQIKYRLIRHHP